MRYHTPTFFLFGCCIFTFVATAVRGAGYLPLQLNVPLNHRVEIDTLRARDRVRHGRILRASVGGVVDFRVQGSSDPSTLGYG